MLVIRKKGGRREQRDETPDVKARLKIHAYLDAESKQHTPGDCAPEPEYDEELELSAQG